jgi:hypothetical protein
MLAVVKSAAQDRVDDARRNNRQPPAVDLLILQADDITDLVVIMLNIDR